MVSYQNGQAYGRWRKPIDVDAKDFLQRDEFPLAWLRAI
jgi:hypothetical protein